MTTFPEGALMTRGGREDGRVVNLPMETTTIGRLPFNDVVIDDSSVSRQHAAVRGDSEGYWVHDQDSSNGTFVNGERLGTERRQLSDKDDISLGGLDDPFYWEFTYSQTTRSMSIAQRRRAAVGP